MPTHRPLSLESTLASFLSSFDPQPRGLCPVFLLLTQPNSYFMSSIFYWLTTFIIHERRKRDEDGRWISTSISLSLFYSWLKKTYASHNFPAIDYPVSGLPSRTFDQTVTFEQLAFCFYFLLLGLLVLLLGFLVPCGRLRFCTHTIYFTIIYLQGGSKK